MISRSNWAKDKQDIEREAAQGIGRVELLRYRNEADVVLFEDLDNAGEVDQRPAQPVHLVDDHAVDRPAANVGQEPFQGGPVQVAAAEAAIVVALGQGDKPLAALAEDEGFGGLALRVERVEFLIEAFVGGLAGVDGATELANGCSRERVSFRLECAIQDQSPFSCGAKAVAP